MKRIIGAASEFYRLRVASVDATKEPDFEWRDDILYRTPPAEAPDEQIEWVIEAVTIDADETVSRVARFSDYDEVHEFLGTVEEDLRELTKSAFEERYLSTDRD
jgi:hypothetical protein